MYLISVFNNLYFKSEFDEPYENKMYVNDILSYTKR